MSRGVRLRRRGPARSTGGTRGRWSPGLFRAAGLAWWLLVSLFPLAPASATTAGAGGVQGDLAAGRSSPTLGRAADFSFALGSAASVEPWTLVQTIQTSQLDPPSPDPAGVTYMPGPDRLMVADSEVDEMTIFRGVNLYQLTRTGSLTDTGVTTAFSNEPTGLGFNPANDTLFVSDDNKDRVFLIRRGPDGRHGTSDDQVTSISTSAFGSGDPEGVEYDTNSGHLFVADGVGQEVYEVSPGANGTFDGVPAAGGDDVVTHFDIGQFGVVDGEGIGHDPSRDTLVIADRGSRRIFEVTKSGGLVRIFDISTIPGIRNPAGITVVPASDDPGRMDYWIVDRGRDNSTDPNENDGKLYRVAAGILDAPPSVAITAPAQGASVTGTLSIEASASDDEGVTKVEFFVDGTSIGTDTNGADGWSTSWDTTTAAEGPHTISATATDTKGQTSSHSIGVTVDHPGVSALDVPVGSGQDDVEERPDGRVRIPNADLELVTDGVEVQTVGLRFTGISVPARATILNAYVQFRTDEKSSLATSLTVMGESSDNALPFTKNLFNVSSRPDTTASVQWTPPAWNVVGEAGPAQRTPDLNAVLQEIVGRLGWGSGNALVLVITGSGKRVAESFEGGFPPILHIEYMTG